jgi:eukaryotic-like serine/threonine-protein kinase
MPVISTPFPDVAARRVGTLLCDKWRIGRILGSGGMSVVHQGVHRNGKRVAIKVLHPDLAMRPRARRRFLREGYIANRVAHPGAVSVIDDGIADDGTVFLVMELLEGETIGQQLRRNTAAHSMEQVLAVADAVLDVLACAHDRGIVHRDVKPDNIFVTGDGQIKLLDFGIASLRELAALGPDTTGTGLALGTPAFMAPEQARGRPDAVDRRTDLWALGATMFTLLMQRHVHQGQSRNESLILSATRPAPLLRELVQQQDYGIAEVVDRALAFAKDDRWPDAQSMQRALRIESEGRTPSRPTPLVPPHGLDAQQTASDSLIEPADSAWSRRDDSAAGPIRRAPRSSRGVTLATAGAVALFAGALLLQLTRSSAATPLHTMTTGLARARSVPRSASSGRLATLQNAVEPSAGNTPTHVRADERARQSVQRSARMPKPVRAERERLDPEAPAASRVSHTSSERSPDLGPHRLLSDELLDQRD